jgi:hypothetical protein
MVLLRQLPTGSNVYKVKSYIEAASTLQAMGRSKACYCMMKAIDDHKGEALNPIMILCRMLFVKRSTSDFEGPALGRTFFYGDTKLEDWSLYPIELVDDIPIKILGGYIIYGADPSSGYYLNYCMTNCDWSTIRYQAKTKEQMKAALEKLLRSPKWKRPLTEEEIAEISKQIE